MSRVAAVCWVLSGNFFIMQFVVQASWHTPYSLARNPISDLGAAHCAVSALSGYVCSPWHPAMNAAFVATGLLLALGALWIPGSGLLATVLIVLGGTGWVLVGLFPADVAPLPHTLGALLAFVPANLGMLVHARRRGFRGIALLSALGLVAAAVLLCVLPALGDSAKAVNGALERVTAWPFPLAAVLLGAATFPPAVGRNRRRTG
jgi:hypothetical membrane protein